MAEQMQTRMKELEIENRILARKLDQLLAIKEKQTAKVDAKKENTFNAEPVVNTVRAVSMRRTNAGNGVMVNFNSTSGKKNYCLFVKNEWVSKIVLGKEMKVTEHVGKVSGKTSHAIHIGTKATVYGGSN